MFVLSMSFIGPQIAELDMIHRSIDSTHPFPNRLGVADHPAAARLCTRSKKNKTVYANNAIEELEIKWQAPTQKEKHFEAERFSI